MRSLAAMQVTRSMMDYIYGRKDSNGATVLGKEILELLRATALSRAVRWRRDILASAIDECADRKPLPRVLALACGHMREGHLSSALAAKVGSASSSPWITIPRALRLWNRSSAASA